MYRELQEESRFVAPSMSTCSADASLVALSTAKAVLSADIPASGVHRPEAALVLCCACCRAVESSSSTPVRSPSSDNWRWGNTGNRCAR